MRSRARETCIYFFPSQIGALYLMPSDHGFGSGPQARRQMTAWKDSRNSLSPSVATRTHRPVLQPPSSAHCTQQLSCIERQLTHTPCTSLHHRQVLVAIPVRVEVRNVRITRIKAHITQGPGRRGGQCRSKADDDGDEDEAHFEGVLSAGESDD